MGRKVKLDQIFNTITVLTTLYGEKKRSDNRCLVEKLDEVFQGMYFGLFDPQRLAKPVDYTNLCELRDLAVKLYTFKRLSNLKVFDAQYLKDHPELGQERTIEVVLKILSEATSRLGEIYRVIQATQEGEHQSEVDDHLPLVTLLVQILQEILAGLIMNDKLCSEVLRVTNLT